MSMGKEYRKNANACMELAKTAKSETEREVLTCLEEKRPRPWGLKSEGIGASLPLLCIKVPIFPCPNWLVRNSHSSESPHLPLLAATNEQNPRVDNPADCMCWDRPADAV
jgi:hypothetical protein